MERLFGTSSPVIGMVHLRPLPGAPQSDDGLEAVIDQALADLRALEDGGVDGVLVENFGDAPFYPSNVPRHVVASMTRVCRELAVETSIPIGVNVLRNDPDSAVSVAHATDGAYVRVNVHTGARVTDQGVIEGKAHETLRLRDRLGADVKVFADVDVKHSVPLGRDRSDTTTVRDCVERGLADAVIVSGAGTGSAVDPGRVCELTTVRAEHGIEAPIFVGSGVRRSNVEEVLSDADGVIVGTALKKGGETTNRVDPERVAAFMDRVRALR